MDLFMFQPYLLEFSDKVYRNTAAIYHEMYSLSEKKYTGTHVGRMKHNKGINMR